MNKTNTTAALLIKRLRRFLTSPGHHRNFGVRYAHVLLLLSETHRMDAVAKVLGTRRLSPAGCEVTAEEQRSPLPRRAILPLGMAGLLSSWRLFTQNSSAEPHTWFHRSDWRAASGKSAQHIIVQPKHVCLE